MNTGHAETQSTCIRITNGSFAYIFEIFSHFVDKNKAVTSNTFTQSSCRLSSWTHGISSSIAVRTRYENWKPTAISSTYVFYSNVDALRIDWVIYLLEMWSFLYRRYSFWKISSFWTVRRLEYEVCWASNTTDVTDRRSIRIILLFQMIHYVS